MSDVTERPDDLPAEDDDEMYDDEMSDEEYRYEQFRRGYTYGQLRLCAECGEPYDDELPEWNSNWSGPIQYCGHSSRWCLSCHLGLDEASGGNRKLAGEPEWFLAESILERLRRKFGDLIPSNIRDVRIIQSAHTVWLEVTCDGNDSQNPGVVKIHREGLGVPDDSSAQPLFHPRHTISTNASAFLRLDAVDLCHIADHLFAKTTRDRVMAEYTASLSDDGKAPE